MSMAARLGDPTAHGGAIVAGMPTVIIGGQPAARVADFHACPSFTGPVPHVGGPIVLGAVTVLVGNLPQARMGDMATCVGPPDSIAAGCPTVVVGAGGGAGAGGAGGAAGALAGAAASGVRQPTGAAQPSGQAMGDGRYATPFASVTVAGDAVFTASALRALRTLAARETGRAALDALGSRGAAVTVRDDGGAGASVQASPREVTVAMPLGALEDIARVEGDSFALERCLWVALDVAGGGALGRVAVDLRMAG